MDDDNNNSSNEGIIPPNLTAILSAYDDGRIIDYIKESFLLVDRLPEDQKSILFSVVNRQIDIVEYGVDGGFDLNSKPLKLINGLKDSGIEDASNRIAQVIGQSLSQFSFSGSLAFKLFGKITSYFTSQKIQEELSNTTEKSEFIKYINGLVYILPHISCIYLNASEVIVEKINMAKSLGNMENAKQYCDLLNSLGKSYDSEQELVYHHRNEKAKEVTAVAFLPAIIIKLAGERFSSRSITIDEVVNLNLDFTKLLTDGNNKDVMRRIAIKNSVNEVVSDHGTNLLRHVLNKDQQSFADYFNLIGNDTEKTIALLSDNRNLDFLMENLKDGLEVASFLTERGLLFLSEVSMIGVNDQATLKKMLHEHDVTLEDDLFSVEDLNKIEPQAPDDLNSFLRKESSLPAANSRSLALNAAIGEHGRHRDHLALKRAQRYIMEP